MAFQMYILCIRRQTAVFMHASAPITLEWYYIVFLDTSVTMELPKLDRKVHLSCSQSNHVEVTINMDYTYFMQNIFDTVSM